MPETDTNTEERIAKVLARRGVCSRREAERMISQGLVSVDGVTLTSPAFKVGKGADIRVDGSRIPEPSEPRLWLYHKPKGLITSARDPQGRGTVFDHLPKDMPRVMAVGRLDLNSEGLLLLTNDGEIKRHLELPSTGWRRRYRARIYGRLKDEDIARLTKGIRCDGELLKAEEASLEKSSGQNCWLNVVLTEGRNREIRRMVEAVGAQVNRLIRVSYGPFQLGGLKTGEVTEVTAKVLREQLGNRSARKERPRRTPKKIHADRRR